jgi:hypothetical protein
MESIQNELKSLDQKLEQANQQRQEADEIESEVAYLRQGLEARLKEFLAKHEVEQKERNFGANIQRMRQIADEINELTLKQKKLILELHQLGESCNAQAKSMGQSRPFSSEFGHYQQLPGVVHQPGSSNFYISSLSQIARNAPHWMSEYPNCDIKTPTQ